MGAVDLHVNATSDLRRTIRIAKFLGFSMLGLASCEGMESEVVNLCKQERMRCVFRVRAQKARRAEARGYDEVYVADSGDEARASAFDLLEVGATAEEVSKVEKFCTGAPRVRFAVEVDFASLRHHGGDPFTRYVNALARVMAVCKRRRITIVFSSGARGAMELIPPRALYYLYRRLGGTLEKGEALSETPLRMVRAKLNSRVKLIGGT